MSTDAAILLCELLARKLGVEGVTFAVNRRLRHLLGRANHDARRIELSAAILRLSPEHVVDTIKHELAHVAVGAGHGHDEVWQAKALEFGADPRACAEDVSKADIARYTAECACAPGRNVHSRNQLRSFRIHRCMSCRTVLAWRKNTL